MAFQCLTTIAILGEFEEVKRGIAKIQRELSRAIDRQEATFIGEIISSHLGLDKLDKEFEICHRFTNDMITRLSILEDSINPAFHRYNYLYPEMSLTDILGLLLRNTNNS